MNLDESSTYKTLDTSGMLALIKTFPSQCAAAWQSSQGFSLPSDYTGIKKVVIAGVGGSAISGDFLQSLVEPEGIPVNIYRDYEIPPITDASSLFIASSHSGNTEETLSAFSGSLKTAAKKIAVTTGGKLVEEAKRHGVPAFLMSVRDYPPRYAMGYSFIGMLGLVRRTCSLSFKNEYVSDSFKSLESFGRQFTEDIPSARNAAKALALKTKGKIVVIYGAGITSAVARRWKAQFNENGKVWSFYETFPELNHNSIEGYDIPDEVKGKIVIIMLKSNFIHPRTQLRYEITGELLKKSGIPFEVVQAEGKSPLSQLLNLTCLGDYASYYLALLNGCNPGPVDNVTYLKGRLA